MEFPPCQSHSSFRQNICVRFRGTDAIYPDMSLYQQIIFLKHNTSAKWIIENVNPYYKPLINPDCKIGRHLVWSNFKISELQTSNIKIRTAQIQDLQAYHKIDLVKYNVKNKRQLLRNCVDKRIGQHIFNEMLNA